MVAWPLSVEPYELTRTRVPGNVAPQPASTSAPGGSPTKKTARTSGQVVAESRSHARATDGTTVTTVNRSWASHATTPSGGAVPSSSGTTSVAPAASGGNRSRRLASKLTPATKEKRSPAATPKSGQNQSTKERSAAPEPSTAFGSPVEPEVK